MEGILLINKAKGNTSFKIVAKLRKRLKIKKIGHSGTLDPAATGLMVMLIGRNYTKKSNLFLNDDKQYLAEIKLGYISDSYDEETKEKFFSSYIPSTEEINKSLSFFSGEILQTPPMYSAKKIDGKRLYKYARKGIEIERAPVKVKVNITLIDYVYPSLKIKIDCSKGTYIRSIAHDLGKKLSTGAILSKLTRTKSGKYFLENATDENLILDENYDITSKIFTI